jgi:HrpA-like RNA helicase
MYCFVYSEGVLVFLTGQEEIEAMAANIPNIARVSDNYIFYFISSDTFI